MTVLTQIANGSSGLDSRDTLNAALFSTGGSPTPFPAGFNLWDFTRFPINVYRNGYGSYRTDFKPQAISGIADIFAGVAGGATKVYYADRSKADNSGNGLTAATAKQGIRQAIALGEADGTCTSIIVYCAPGDYDRTADMVGSGSGVTLPTKPTAVIGYGGTVIVGPTALLTWTLDAGTTYKVVRSTVARVINKTVLDSRGNGIPMARYTTKAALTASVVDGYYLDTTGADGTVNTLYVKRADGAVVADANTRVILLTDSCRPGATHFYTSGITWMGGTNGTLQRNSAATTQNIAAEDCQFLYPAEDGAVTNAGNCVTVDYDGICALARCTYGYSIRDAVNPHGLNAKTHMLVNQGEGYAIGATPGTSCNLLTAHENVPLIGVGYTGTGAAGGSWRNVNTSQMAIFGCALDADRGDLANGGNTPSTGVMTENTAIVWAWEPTIKRCQIALNALSGTAIYYRNPITLSGAITGAGTVATF